MRTRKRTKQILKRSAWRALIIAQRRRERKEHARGYITRRIRNEIFSLTAWQTERERARLACRPSPRHFPTRPTTCAGALRLLLNARPDCRRRKWSFRDSRRYQIMRRDTSPSSSSARSVRGRVLMPSCHRRLGNARTGTAGGGLFVRTRNFDNDDYKVTRARRSVLHVYVLSLFPPRARKKTTLRLFPFRSFLTLKKQRFEKINALVFCSSTSRKS